MALLNVKFYSAILNEDIKMNVILPQAATTLGLDGADSPDHLEKTYPVLYLLHGMGDNEDCWSQRTSLERFVENTGIAVVMPSGKLSWYVNSPKTSRWRAFIGEELPAICHDFFPRISTKREDTYIAGNSMGGYGAYAVALTYPERYCAAYGLSGAYVPFETTVFNFNDPYWTDIFGNPENFDGSENDLRDLSAKLLASGRPLPKLAMWCGYGDIIYNQSLLMRDHLQKIGWPDFQYKESEGEHDWNWWNIKIQDTIAWILENRK